MTDLKKISKRMSYVLRHRPDTVGLTLDAAGWVEVDVLLAALRLTRADLDLVVAGNDKQRFAVEGDRIRASQGHSVDVDLGYEPATPPEVLYHGTPAANVAAILAQGLVKGRRHHVHLSADVATARTVGERRGRAVVLTVRSGKMAGHAFFRSANGVWLTDHVPPSVLSVAGHL